MNRRDFTKFLTTSSLLLGVSCHRPEIFHFTNVKQEHSTSYENIIKYCTNFHFANFPIGIFVETYEKLPFRITGDKINFFNKGVVPKSALGSIYNLYDKHRLSKPVVNGKETSLNEALEHIFAKIEKNLAQDKMIAVFMPLINSPFLKFKISQIENFTDKIIFIGIPPFDFFSSQHQANYISLKKNLYLLNDITKATTIINFGRDFLEHDPFYPFFVSRLSDNRNLKIFTFEDTYSLTGANSDVRIPIRLNDYLMFGLSFLKKLLQTSNQKNFYENFIDTFNGIELPTIPENILPHLEYQLPNIHFLCNDYLPPSMQVINLLLNFFSKINSPKSLKEKLISLDLQYYTQNKQKLEKFLKYPDEFNLLIFLDYDPYFYINSSLLKQVGEFSPENLITLSLYKSKLSENSGIFIPLQHYLEYWLDLENLDKSVCSQQQIVLPFNTHSISLPEFICLISNKIEPNATTNIYSDELIDFYKKFYNDTSELSENLRNGLFLTSAKSLEIEIDFKALNVQSIFNFLKSEIISPTKNTLSIRIIPEQDTYAGMYSNNVYLKELPSSVEGVSWDTPIFIPSQLAQEKEIINYSKIKILSGSNSTTLPCVVLANITIHSPFLIYRNNYYFEQFFHRNNPKAANFDFLIPNISELTINCEIQPTNDKFEVAKLNRTIALEEISQKLAPLIENSTQMYSNKIQPPGNKWTMIIDVDKCIGCNLCILACQIENNIPVVGKEQILQKRDLYWINVIQLKTRNGKRKFIPILCQHCDYAPCESVCPVGATSHTTDGINEMTYSRCIGSRFCMANCPYNVRRFNFKGAEDTHINFEPKMTNPFVTLRSRGITEKCSFCIHRINFERTKSSLFGIKDFSVTTACQEICPVSAITFGRKSNILIGSEKIKDLKVLLPNLNTLPNVFYKIEYENL